MISKSNKFIRSLKKTIGLLTIGSIIGQSFTLITFWLIARYYEKQDIGLYAVFMSYAAIISTVSLLSFDKIIPSIEVTKLGPLLSGCIILLIIISVVSSCIFRYFGFEFHNEIFLILLGQGLAKISEQLNTRNNCFKLIFLSRICPGLIFFMGIVLCIFIMPLKSTYLIRSQVYSLVLFGLFYFWLSAKINKGLICNIREMLNVFSSEKKFSLLVSPSELLNNLSHNVPTILIEKLFGVLSAAQYGMTLRFGMAPVNMIGGAASQIMHSFIAKQSNFKDTKFTENLGEIKKNLRIIGVIISLCSIFGFSFFLPLILGDGWEVAGYFGIILSPMYGVMIAISPMAVIFYVYRKQEILLSMQFLYFVIVIISMFAGYSLGNLYISIALICILNILRYVYMRFYINRTIIENMMME